MRNVSEILSVIFNLKINFFSYGFLLIRWFECLNNGKLLEDLKDEVLKCNLCILLIG